MIVVRAPMRVSFAGGFSDAAARSGGGDGAVLSATINVHAYITAQVRKDRSVVAAYSEVEKAENASGVRNALFREALAATGIFSAVEVHSIGALSLASGGLGGSGAAAVGMIAALSALKGRRIGTRDIAETAAGVELRGMNRAVGKQDHYAAAYGGLNVFRFNGDYVKVQRLDESMAGVLSGRMFLAPCHAEPRDASEMLSEQLKADPGIPRALAALVPDALEAFEKADFCALCSVLREGWRLKKSLSPRMSNPAADVAVAEAERVGGGAKLCGAGGSGHVWALVHEDFAWEYLSRVPGAFRVDFEPRGVDVIYDDGERAS